MNLSIAVITAGKPYAARTLTQAREWADLLGAELVVAGDGDEGVVMARQYADIVLPVSITNHLAESIVPALANTCRGEWILRFDDDETGSAAMLEWLQAGAWNNTEGDTFSFPRGHLYPDDLHFITNSPLFPDKQARLMKRNVTARWNNHVHAGAPAGYGTDIPAMLLHHKFLVRTFEERQETARIYDSHMAGAGSGSYFGHFTLPELFYVNGVTVRAVGTGATNAMDTEKDEVVECSRKTGLDSTLIGKSGWSRSKGNRVLA